MLTQMKNITLVASLSLLLVVGGMRMQLVEGKAEVGCPRQIFSGQLSQCIDYLVYGHQGPPELFEAGYNSEVLEQCCKQLDKVTQECRCDAINRMLLEEKHIVSQKLEGVVRRARNLPAMCNMEPHRCDLQFYF